MTTSIYQLFAYLVANRLLLRQSEKLASFPFPDEMLSLPIKRKRTKKGVVTDESESGQFPDLAIKINKGGELFGDGGELLELKDSNSRNNSYAFPSFNSTIPTGKKPIRDVVPSESSNLYLAMLERGDNVWSLEMRDVYYLVRGRIKNKERVKICLVHGSFFETIKPEELVKEAFRQVLEEQIDRHEGRLDEPIKQRIEELKETFISLFDKQQPFSRVRTVDNASVTLRFRVMTEAAAGNILNAKKYPRIQDETLNFVVPAGKEQEKEVHLDRVQAAFEEINIEPILSQLKIFEVAHPFNGVFLVFQIGLQ